MDLIERLVGHDLWTTGELLRRCRELTDAQLDAEVYSDHRTVRATLTHMIGNLETWSNLMDLQPRIHQRIGDGSLDDLVTRHELAAIKFHALARKLAGENRLEERFTDLLDQPPTQKTYCGAIAHVITHNMHHRAQLLYMLDKLGLTDLPEGDLLGWEMRYRFE